MNELFRIDPALVERCIMSLAELGAHGETGVARATYTSEWVAAQELVSAWCRDAGMDVRMDAVGSVWGRVEGTEGGKSIVSGSHIDSQCPGGRYDGALGVIAAYIAISTLHQRFGRPKRTLEVVSLCEEEGSRYPAGNFWGSRAITGRIAPGDADAIPGMDGGTIADGMRAVGLDPAQTDDAIRADIDTYVELHIEQGPLLEQAGVPVAVVTGITGLREYWITLHGRADHAGARPMDLRRDPMAGAAEIISNAINTAHRMGRPAVTTVGRMTVEPNASPIVPERVSFTIDARHPDPVQREILYARHEAMMREVAQRRDLELSWEIVGEHAPALSDPALVQTFVDAARSSESRTLRCRAGPRTMRNRSRRSPRSR
jgi:allantoate deiminase